MKQQVVILGAGSQAREISEYVKQNGGEVLAYLVDAAYVADAAEKLGERVLAFGSTESKALAGTEVVIGVGYPGAKRKIADKWHEDRYGAVVAAGAWRAADVRLGAGVVIAPQTALSVNVKLGDHVLVNIGATVSHDCTVGDYTTISPGAHLAGNVTVGQGVFIGIGATVIQGISIGDGALVAAGAVVTHDVPPGTMVAGVPAVVKRPKPEWP